MTGRRMSYRRLIGLVSMLTVVLALMAGAVAFSPASYACDPGSYYDPSHQICQPYVPANPQPGYPQTCSGGYYDPEHTSARGTRLRTHRRFTPTGRGDTVITTDWRGRATCGGEMPEMYFHS